jgi:murein DD-endopeptidase MepM/ murein hydrolase activator NlpD
MEYQIILLPHNDYWGWVRASQEYVLQYGANLTQDPATAGRYMAPAQVITFPRVEGGYPVATDLESWFQANYPGVRLDIIEAQNPKQLEREFEQRLEDQDRYGQKRKSFYLLWPTDFPVITQAFGANPQIYSRFGVPAHEGLDIRAFSKSKIYACAAGEVFQVHLNPRTHPYGIHVRIRHKDGYKTIYGHLAKPTVVVGEAVEAGQVIGLADSTGASTGSHLHLTLKRDGATERQETDFPKDILDPTPFMVWPEGSYRKSIQSVSWAPSRCLIGAHGRVDGPMTADDVRMVEVARLEAIKLHLADTEETIEGLRAVRPGIFLMVRVTMDFSQEAIKPDEFVKLVRDDYARHYASGIRYFELHANPNTQFAGLRRTWKDGSEFADWFYVVQQKLRGMFPESKLGFPGLAPGPDIPGWQEDSMRFLDQADESIYAADWIGVHSQWLNPFGMASMDGGRVYELYRHRYPGKTFFITEFYNPSAVVSADVKAGQYLNYFEQLRDEPGIGAAFSFALSAESGHASMVWRDDAGEEAEIARIIGGRTF